MRIIIDIGHPGHVHYFRNFYKIMKENDHDFLFIARDKEVSFSLLNFYKIPFKSRGKGRNSIFGKIIYFLYADFIILKNALKFKPDVFLSFSSAYMGHIAFVLGKPNIIIDDTEHASFEHLMYKPFASTILTPSCFYKNMGKKQIKFDSYTELFYLHKNYFVPDIRVFEKLGISKDENYAIVRFVSWGASHDVGQKGFTDNSKYEIIKKINNQLKVFITSESELSQKLEQYKLNISPEELHSVLAFSSLYIGEGGTTASETSILGIPTLYVNTLPLMGYLKDEEDSGLLFHFQNEIGLLHKVNEILSKPAFKNDFSERAVSLIENKIDPTLFLIWFVSNYPESKKIMKDNPDYQYNFK